MAQNNELKTKKKKYCGRMSGCSSNTLHSYDKLFYTKPPICGKKYMKPVPLLTLPHFSGNDWLIVFLINNFIQNKKRTCDKNRAGEGK